MRRPRRNAPPFPAGEIVLEPPSEIPEPEGGMGSRLMMILPMMAGAVAMMLLFAGNSGGLLRMITGGLLGVAMLGMVGTQFSRFAGSSKGEMTKLRRGYLFELSGVRRTVRSAIRTQRAAEYFRHPEPGLLWSLVDSSRLWERRPADPDFGQVRLGLGARDLATPLVPPPFVPVEKAEPVSAGALRRFLTTYRQVDQLPIVVALDGFAAIHLHGDLEQARHLARAIVAQAAFFHAPDDLLVGACAGDKSRYLWEWVKWLPHAAHPENTDALGPLRLVTTSVAALEAMLEETLSTRPRFNPAATEISIEGPHVLVVVDGAETAGSDHLAADGGVEGATVVWIGGEPPRHPDRSTLVVKVGSDGKLTATTHAGSQVLGYADDLPVVVAECLAHQLSPLRLARASTGEQAMTFTHDLTDLLDIPDPYALDPEVTWQPRPNRQRLRVPIGVGPDGERIELDLKESAQDGMGPHGLLIGATGSGKSELLRTMVLALAVTHPPEILNFVLVDFKGGATFTKLDLLPHTSAVITNLADELPLVDRMTDAINGELVRRQELLRRAGNYASLRDYERARLAGVPLEPVPSLLIVCDEFSELLSAKPDFIDMFVQIGRLGRSLGVHLLLASQRLEEGRLRGLDTHLSYRIGLRTFSPMESRAVLGVTDAYELPRAPGHGFLKFGVEAFTRFRAAYVSGVHRRTQTAAVSDAAVSVTPFVSGYVAKSAAEEAKSLVDTDDLESATGDTLLDILTDRLTGHGSPAHQVWLPPLSDSVPIDAVLGDVTTVPGLGLTVADPTRRGTLDALAGVVDRPFEQRREALRFQLSGAAGHIVVVGAPQTGKSTLLRSIILGLALTHTPDQVQFYCVDFGGGGLAALADLPHVGSVASRREPDLLRRTIAELVALLGEREQFFADHRIESVAAFRRRAADGEFGDQRCADVFLVIDGWLTLRNDFEDLEPKVHDLANRGLTYGIHVIAAANRWFDLRPSVRDLFGSRVELRLGDPSDSAIGRRAAANVPQDVPGRGITAESYQFLGALPALSSIGPATDEGVSSIGPTTDEALSSIGPTTDEAVTAIRAAWTGRVAPKVRLLPERIEYAEVLAAADRPEVPIGLGEADLRPVYLDLDADPHFLVYGETECGKSSFLRMLARGIADRRTPDQARIIALDYRRSLLGTIPASHLIGYATSADQGKQMLTEAYASLRKRLPGPDITPEQLRARDWWTGPELFVLVDDFDLVAGDKNPLLLLQDLLPSAREVGLHLVITKRGGGGGRSAFDQTLVRLKEVTTPGLVMSGDKNDGPILANVRASHMPPGRAWLVTRKDGARLIQASWLDSPHGTS
ncbi:MAG: type VII secretion protein EccCa [Hamadaea sp.]|uniref:type VII secretion protein EccCa n=1 Tax=Hamadaea sp. TaxID=2024425 RepID=UPI00185005E5|nr:type VII secretion protein EccCa [Hamadaea sp.]NUT20406.1 type VII secretion protein EccCa [Hamadaea sp.]